MPYWDKASEKYRATKMIDGLRRTKTFKTKAEARKWEAHQTEETWIAEQHVLALLSILEWSVKYLEYSKVRHTAKTFKSEKVVAFNQILCGCG